MKLGCFSGVLVLVLIASAPSPAQNPKPKISDLKLREAVAKYEEALAKFNDGDPDPWIACWSKREDALQLFGFWTADERSAFLRLIAVSGIGPKIALAVLSGIGISDLERAVHEGDRGMLERIPGIGRKTAPAI